MLKSSGRWWDCPTDYGPSTTGYNRFNCWSARDFWLGLLETLVDAGAVTRTAIDSTYVEAERAALGGERELKRRRSAARAPAGRPKSTGSPLSSVARSR